jgi:Fe-S-cluster containining protein
MREFDQKLMSRAMAAIRQSTPSCTWSAFADVIAAERSPRELHLETPAGQANRDLAGGLEKLRTDGVVVHPLKLEAEKVAAVRRYLEGMPAYGGSHIYSSDRQLRPLAEVRNDSPLAGYTADQLLRAPYLVDFFNHPAIVDFVQSALGCVPTLYSLNAWWSFPARTPTGINNQFFHRDNDDWRFVTLFLYLTDVDGDSGPHQLIAGSHTLDGMQRQIDRAARAAGHSVPIDALDSFRNFFGAEFSAKCENFLRESIVNIEGAAGTIFTANTIALHRGLVPAKAPRLVVWARYGLGPNTNSVDLEQGPLSHAQVVKSLPDTLRNRYVNRLLFEFDRGPEPAYLTPEHIPAPAKIEPPVRLTTTNLRLTLGGFRIVHPISVPEAAVPASDVVPALQGLVNAVVETAEAGKAISCRKGCGACCRQLVPISRTEGERLLDLVEAMPEERRGEIKRRFAAAEAILEPAGFNDRAGKTDRELSTSYFALGVPCPFLEEESCSIHAERPLVCREYLVTSPAELCAGPVQAGVTPVPVPKFSLAARRLQDDKDEWFPLALLMAWSRSRPKSQTRRTGPEWVQRFLKNLGSGR